MQKASIKGVTEYAKSIRSSCKKCSEAIPAKSLRLGSDSKERGHNVIFTNKSNIERRKNKRQLGERMIIVMQISNSPSS
ncbi:hypothetical protein C5167_004671 [Papaver somniferum]|uniref:PARP-type domain-containing protein n=1 Tax=Papaver somniferum TaxID=3469 RepID=A0A4Y7JBT3_PAPSO|nr:hypothetical protein C5167_004671 [Papaver somniferum]